MKNYTLVGDIGGTNARLALCDLNTHALDFIENYSCDDFDSLESIIQIYLSKVGVAIADACIAIACPIEGDRVKMTNQHWTFSIQEMKANLSLRTLEVINDFTAISYAVPMLSDDDVLKVTGTTPQPGKPKVIFGAGTGMGVAHLLEVNQRWISIPGEGGHRAFSSASEEEDHILAFLRKQYGHVSVERLLSGPGLVNIYHGLRDYLGLAPEDISPMELTSRASNGSCDVCTKALTIFCSALGGFGGDLALNMGAFGGVYIAGGVVPKFLDFFLSSPFKEAFLDKGRFKDYLKDIPVYLIQAHQVGLLGSGFYLKQVLQA